jgi:hypothetical protein
VGWSRRGSVAGRAVPIGGALLFDHGSTTDAARLAPGEGEPSSPDWSIVHRWLDAYISAWGSYDEAALAVHWTEDARSSVVAWGIEGLRLRLPGIVRRTSE